ncbi:hypothetical protein A3J90_01620 [candidate division WOR-1 bacterium RIFOXYC2_FULL_37_10]|uniref:Uncharacterized protein n=1 Tax=candidate division WOR-1 bacterium RIFOXYB2_FULL_37_13 TaxID=1802579 RepID=A0A1F4SPJ2_UNCSA|nr:MAG: hypothetical protein A2246_02325 [candidate division WOR-1 bacterium RIFOXYA2_FULL_37_7]OGC22366.1 MAG: hypothetical protein A2310_01730 [candidate division WOR-1 bacterium RIFOXYB2_FULL_37_13]OGC35804.1 MAG: hypothetical protein A3J90_01620 [candidate division WOR-1 bacterium RIFOXYC2_FULL_37_10]
MGTSVVPVGCGFSAPVTKKDDLTTAPEVVEEANSNSCQEIYINPPICCNDIDVSDANAVESKLYDEIAELKTLLSAPSQDNEISSSAERIAELITLIYCAKGMDKACEAFSLLYSDGYNYIKAHSFVENEGATPLVFEKLVSKNPEIATAIAIGFYSDQSYVIKEVFITKSMFAASLSPKESADLISEIFKRDKDLAIDIFLLIDDRKNFFTKPILASIKDRELLAYLFLNPLLLEDIITVLNLNSTQTADLVVSAYDIAIKEDGDYAEVRIDKLFSALTRIDDKGLKLKTFQILINKYPKQAIGLLTFGAIKEKNISNELAEKLSQRFKTSGLTIPAMLASFVLFIYDEFGQKEAGKVLNNYCQGNKLAVRKMFDLLFSQDRETTKKLLAEEIYSAYLSYVAQACEDAGISDYEISQLLVDAYKNRKNGGEIAGNIFYSLKDKDIKKTIALFLFQFNSKYAAPIMTFGEITEEEFTGKEIDEIAEKNSSWQEAIALMILKTYEKNNKTGISVFNGIILRDHFYHKDKWAILYEIAKQERSVYAGITSCDYCDQVLCNIISFPFENESTPDEKEKANLILLARPYLMHNISDRVKALIDPTHPIPQ